jgi:hypothetical protein
VVGVGDNARHGGVVEDLGHATIEYGVGPCGLGSSIRQDKKQAIWCKPANSVSSPVGEEVGLNTSGLYHPLQPE